jgi:general secretion pathway protein I
MKTIARPCTRSERGFTLLEVMISLAVVAIAMLALLSLHHQDLRSVLRAQDLSRAAMLAQAVMTQTEISGYPDVGTSTGDFQAMFPRRYPNFRWRREVASSAIFPDLHKVTVTVYYGPRFSVRFDLVEFLHNPAPPENPPEQQQP